MAEEGRLEEAAQSRVETPFYAEGIKEGLTIVAFNGISSQINLRADELQLWSDGPAEGTPVPPPGEFIRRELEVKGWGQADLAEVLGRPLPTINEIIQGKKAITPEMAIALGTAFGTGAMLWMQRESAYRVAQVRGVDEDTRLRTRLYDFAPVREMERRGWIRPTQTARELERELCDFFDVATLDDEPQIRGLARQTFRAEEFTTTQRAWLWQTARLATVLNVRKFNLSNFVSSLGEIRALATHAERTRHIPEILAEVGVRLVVSEPIPKSRIDGAAFWLDTEPVIALSLRFDRIDSFWQTLLHEASHIKNGDLGSIDSNLFGEHRSAPLDEMEERADREAAESLIPPDKLHSFISRIKPLYSKEKICQFAQRMQVHPGIVVGQLQHLHEIKWSANRDMMAKVRDVITTTAITDGWGCPPIRLGDPF